MLISIKWETGKISRFEHTSKACPKHLNQAGFGQEELKRRTTERDLTAQGPNGDRSQEMLVKIHFLNGKCVHRDVKPIALIWKAG